MRLIIVDGLDGVGKDTHAQLIKERYEKNGYRDKSLLQDHTTNLYLEISFLIIAL